MKPKNRVFIFLLMLSLLFPALLPSVAFAAEGSYETASTCIEIGEATGSHFASYSWVYGNTLFLAVRSMTQYHHASIGGVEIDTLEEYPTGTNIYMNEMILPPGNFSLWTHWVVFKFPLNEIVVLGSGTYPLILDYYQDNKLVSDTGTISITVPTASSVFFARYWDGGPMNKDMAFRLQRKTIVDGAMDWASVPGSEVDFFPGDKSYEWKDLPFADKQGYIYSYTVESYGTVQGYESLSYFGGEVFDCRYEYEVMVHYTPSGSFTPKATKEFVDGDLAEHTFRFGLYKQVDQGAWAVVEMVDSKSDGKIPFSKIYYNEDDIGKEYIYQITEEVLFGHGNIFYDTDVREFKVTVTDNGDGTLGVDVKGLKDMVFINTWRVIDISVEKIWENAPTLKPSVTIHLRQNGTSIGSVTLDGSEADPWNHMWQVPLLDEEGEPFKYTVWEETVLDGYEEPEYGHLGEWAMTVTNKKIPLVAVEIEIPGKVELEGRELNADEFGFSIYNASDLKNPIQSVRNAKDGTFFFLIEFEEGKHQLVIKEDKGKLEHVTYDETEIKLDVSVSKDAGGSLVAKVMPKTDIVFKNTYEPPKAPSTENSVGTGYLLTGLVLLVGLLLLGGVGYAIYRGRKKKEQ